MQGQEESKRNHLDSGGAFNLIAFLASVHTTALTPFIRRGFGLRSNGWNGVGAMVLLVLWCCADPNDPVMGVYLLLWFFALICQKAYTQKRIGQGDKIHSQYWGDPWIAMKVPFCRDPATARRFEPGMCFIIGLSLIGVSEALAALWMCGFVSLTIVLCVEHVVTEAKIQAIDDAEIEARHYADLRSRRNR